MANDLHILERIKNDEILERAWEKLDNTARQMFREIDEGIRVPNMLSDTIFKGIFNPDVHGDYLSEFISSVLGRKVKVLHSLSNEGYSHSEHSKKVIFDLLVQFEDGSIANVEIQRMGIAMPSTRAAVYSADIVSRQFATIREQSKGSVDYDSVQPVYTIIIFEKSSGEFLKSENYIHHFKQKSDTGIELEFLQYYDYICLDIFRKKNPKVAGKLENWLTFLSIQDVKEMNQFLLENPSFQAVYDCAIIMLKDREGLLKMISDFWANEDVVASLNKTNESKIKRLEKENAKLQTEYENELAKKDDLLNEKDSLINEKDAEILRLKSLLQEKEF